LNGVRAKDLTPILIYYTHNEHLVFFPVAESKVFNKSYNEFARRLMTLDGIITGTQSTRNRDAIKENYPWADSNFGI